MNTEYRQRLARTVERMISSRSDFDIESNFRSHDRDARAVLEHITVLGRLIEGYSRDLAAVQDGEKSLYYGSQFDLSAADIEDRLLGSIAFTAQRVVEHTACYHRHRDDRVPADIVPLSRPRWRDSATSWIVKTE